MGSLYDRISKGKLTVDEITKSMERSTSATGKYYQSMEKQSKTFDGMISTLKDNSRALLGEIAKNVSKGMTEDLIPGAMKYIDILNQELELRGTNGLVEAVGLIFGNVLVELTNKAPDLTRVVFNLIDTFVTSISQNSTKIGENAGKVVTEFVTGITEESPKLYEAGTKFVIGLANGIAEEAPKTLPGAIDAITKIVNDNMTANKDASQAGSNLIDSIVDGIIPSTPKIVDTLTNFISGMVKGDNPILYDLMDTLGKKFMGKIGDGLEGGLPDLKELFDFLVKTAFNITGIKKETIEQMKDFGYNLGKTVWNGFLEGLKLPINAAEFVIDKFFGGDEKKATKSKSGMASGLLRGVSSTYSNKSRASAGISSTSPTLNFYDTQTSPDAIYRRFNQTMTYGMARTR